jgi:transcriptional regulator with XRE-family HTH domain
VSDNELGTVIRSRREAITPAEVGLPAGPRRRTPGLRRAELATLAGISVEYLTRIEQGRDRNPSPPVLSALADALLLGPAERRHLVFAAKASSGVALAPCPGTASPSREVRPTVEAVLDRLEPAPALLCNEATDILAHTFTYERLARPLGLLDGENPNLVRYLFTDPRARRAFPDWDQVADQHLATLRSSCAPTSTDLQAIIDELSVVAGAAFTDRMRSLPEPGRPFGAERVAHPEVGELRLRYETLFLDGPRLIVYLPADPAAETALDRLIGVRPGALRSVRT